MEKHWQIYLSGEIHTDWRGEIAAAAIDRDLPVSFSSPVLVHEDSDDCGAVILGEPGQPFFRDQLGARMNSIRTKSLIEEADIVIVRFGDKYRQWNAAFDAGYAAALDIPIITLHDAGLTHALKEVDGAASVTCQSVDQVIKALAYITTGQLDRD